jgi:hypothetical protein
VKLLEEQHDQVLDKLRQELVAKEAILASLQRQLDEMKQERRFALTQDAHTMIEESMVSTPSSPLTQIELAFETFVSFESLTKGTSSKLLHKISFEGQGPGKYGQA